MIPFQSVKVTKMNLQQPKVQADRMARDAASELAVAVPVSPHMLRRIVILTLPGFWDTTSDYVTT